MAIIPNIKVILYAILFFKFEPLFAFVLLCSYLFLSVQQFYSLCLSLSPSLSPFLSREKKLLVSSTDYGKDLFGVQRHLKNHQKLEDELNTHEQALKVNYNIHTHTHVHICNLSFSLSPFLHLYIYVISLPPSLSLSSPYCLKVIS